MVSSYTKILEQKRFNSYRTCLGYHHGRRWIGLGHQYGRRDVMWKHSISSIPNITAIPQLVSALANLLKYRRFSWEGQHTMWTQLLTRHFFYNVDCLVLENMYWMSCDFEEGKDCTRSLSKQPCYLGHNVKFFVICFVLSLITVSNFLSLSWTEPYNVAVFFFHNGKGTHDWRDC